ncbi:MAG: CDP-alcohol phosphatidyltransferase family protein [Clostridia bacterium]|nr:CDP-alcohol phosphatidyltransferase family protein [Clostridia bacterium]
MANIITASRVVCAIILFFFHDINGAFLAIYAYCGISDLIDGPIARKLNQTSNIGALLDTVGDVATYVALAKILLSKHIVPSWAVIWYVSAAVGILSGGLVALARFRRFFVVHSLCGKAMGFFAFLMPFAYYMNLLIPCFAAICITATISAIETVYITVTAADPEHAAISVIGLHRDKKKSASNA